LIYIIGSGFSGLTTAYSLLKKNSNITIISPTEEKNKNKKLTLLKYLFYKNGEIKFNNDYITKKINLIEKVNYKNCKFISSYQDGGLSNIWGGVLSNFNNYNLQKFPYKTKDIKHLKKEYLKLEKIIFKKNFKETNEKNKLNKNISFINFNKSNQNTENLKKYLKKRGVQFRYGFYLKKIIDDKNEILLQDLEKNNEAKLKYQKLYLSCGPINSAKIILNSFDTFKSIKIFETTHFYCLIKKIGSFKNSTFLNFNLKTLKFYAQLYDINNILNIFGGVNTKNIKLFKNYYIAQCYLESNKSSFIKISKIKSNDFLIQGNNNYINNQKIKKIFNLYNQNNHDFKFYFPIMNKTGSSNHLGGSFPMSKINKKKTTKLNGELRNFKNIYLSDSSVMNKIDMQPITMFSLFNILKMNL